VTWTNGLSKSRECWLINWINIKEKAINTWTIIFEKSKSYMLKKKRKKKKK